MNDQRPFTLSELFVAFAVIGLLAGVFSYSHHSNRASDLKQLNANIGDMQQRFATFKDTYGYLPGDFPHATEVWNRAGGDGTGKDCYTVNASRAKVHITCDGNGDGFISMAKGASPDDIWQIGERYHAWVQLFAAGLLDKRFSGVPLSTTDSFSIKAGVNTAKGPIKETTYWLGSIPAPTTPADKHWYSGMPAQNYLSVESEQSFPFTPPEMLAYDSKWDDGAPHSGTVIQTKQLEVDLVHCVLGESAEEARYNTAYKARSCNLRVRLNRP